MADRKLDRYLEQAEKAYRKNDRQKGAQLIDKILQIDFNHRGAWELLHGLYGSSQSLEDFRYLFAGKHYPKQVHLLQKLSPISENPKGKPSAIARLFGRGSKPSQPENNEQPPLTVQERILSSQPPDSLASDLGSDQTPIPEVLSARSGLFGKTPEIDNQDGFKKGLPDKAEPSSGSPFFNPKSQPENVDEKYRVLVVDDISEARENIIRSLHFSDKIEVVGTASNGYQAIDLVKKLKPDVVVMDINMPDLDGIHATATIKRDVPNTQVIILSVQDDLDYMRNAMLAGARDFLAKPPMIDDLIAAVERAATYARQDQEQIGQVGSEAIGGPAQFGKTRGKVITVYSPRGGAGSTTILANLAAVLHKEDTPVVIIDANFQFGSISVMFNVQGSHSLVDLLSHLDDIDPKLVKETLVHHSSGIDILLSTNPAEGDMVNADQLLRLIDFLAQHYSYVLVDCPTHLSDTTLAVLEICDLSVMVITQDIPALARAKKFLDLAPLVNLDAKRILVAINQYDKRIDITPEKLEETLKKEISAVIPLGSETVIPSINRGAPFMLQKQALAQPIGRAMLELVEAVRQQIFNLEQEVDQPKPKA